jgi:hypothetical protein
MITVTKPEVILNRVCLYESHGEISRFIQAAINENGDLLMMGHAIGQFPTGKRNVEEYEFLATVPAQYKDQLLLIFLEKMYKGNSAAVEQVCDFLKEHGIPVEFKSWV